MPVCDGREVINPDNDFLLGVYVVLTKFPQIKPSALRSLLFQAVIKVESIDEECDSVHPDMPPLKKILTQR